MKPVLGKSSLRADNVQLSWEYYVLPYVYYTRKSMVSAETMVVKLNDSGVVQ